MAEKTSSDYELWASLDSSGFAIYRVRELELAPFHLTVEQAATLRVLQSSPGGLALRTLRDLTLRQENSIAVLIRRMEGAGLVENKEGPGSNRLETSITKEGRSVLDRLPADGIERTFSVLETEKKRQLSRCLFLLYDRARSLLLPRGPAFMQYVTGGHARTTPTESQKGGLPSDYILWSQLDGTRFAIARLRELELSQYGLTVEQASILHILTNSQGPVTARSLEDYSLRQHHSVSTLLRRMTRRGILAREKIASERGHRFGVTEDGRSLFARLTSVALEMTFAVLEDAEKKPLLMSLRLLNRQAREVLGAPVLPAQDTGSLHGRH
jgi:DNA-binding MarR family transcriptional regulator